jgi:hypothetical protein
VFTGLGPASADDIGGELPGSVAAPTPAPAQATVKASKDVLAVTGHEVNLLVIALLLMVAATLRRARPAISRTAASRSHL